MTTTPVDKRGEPWPDDEPRQRRDGTWPEDEERQRRRTTWGEFRDAYPRIVTAMALGVLVLLLADAGLAYKRAEYKRESAAARRSMTALEKERADALLASQEGQTALAMALVKQQAAKDERLSLAVSLENGTMELRRDGLQLRTMKVVVGPEAVLGQAPGSARVAPPLGRRHVARVVDASHVWQAPGWVFTQRGQAVPSQRLIRGGLGEIAVLLDDGTALYARPATGPLADESYVLPGAVRVDPADLRAIRENLQPGTPVYFF